MARKKQAAAVRRQPTAKPRKGGARGVPAVRSKARTTAAGKKRKSPARATPKEPSLGRPKVTGEELLYMLFKEDYPARQVFDFLRVETVKELEQYSPQQIVKLLSKPITDAVDSIRRTLAKKNRALLNDTAFAVAYQQQQREEEEQP